MSADLFADFNKPPQDAAKQPASSGSQPAKSDPFDSLFGAAPSNSAAFSQWNMPQAPVQAQKQSTGWDNSAWNSKQQASPTPIATATATADEDDDGWGDFEVAESTQPVAPQTLPTSSLSDFSSFSQPAPAQAQPLGWGAPQAQPKPQQHIFSSDFQDFGLERIQDEEYQQEKHPKLKVKSNAHDPNVLFDVDDFELGGGEGDEDDDFGNFESTAPPPAPTYTKPVQNTARMAPPAAQPPSMDLLSLDGPEPSPPLPEPQTDLRFGALNRTAQTSNSTSRHASKPSFGMTSTSTTTAQRAKSPVKTTAPIQKKAAPATTSFDDDWGAWDDAPAKEAPKITHEAINTTSSWDWEADAAPPAPASGNELPPVNVPPPSILLSLFPELFNLGEPLFQSLAGQTAEAKKQILSNGKTVDFVKGYVLLASTAARVIAGRKQRWHRDKILAKSMSISAAGSKGMKLAGVDKTQSAREDREAADVVTAWKQHVGRLRSAVAVVNATGGIPVKVPELSESIKIQTAKNVPTAAKPCVICGLKRDERLLNVDVDVEDSFGEWWTEHWGHRACKNFWLEHEKCLRQRLGCFDATGSAWHDTSVTEPSLAVAPTRVEEQTAAAAFPARAPPLQRKVQREARPTCPPNTAHQKQPTVFPSLLHFPFQPTQHTTLPASSLPPFNPLNVSLCSPSDSAYLFSSLQPSSPHFTLKSADFSLLCRRFSRFGIPAPVHTTPPPFASLRRSGIILQNSLYSPKLTFVGFDSTTVVFLCLCSFPHRGFPVYAPQNPHDPPLPRPTTRTTTMSAPQDLMPSNGSDIIDDLDNMKLEDRLGPDGEPAPKTDEEYAQAQLTLRAIVSSKEAGVIIGKAGKNVADLRDETGVKAGVSKVVQGVHDRVLTITGGCDAISRAYAIVARALLEGAPAMGMGGIIQSNGTHPIKLLISHNQMGTIIGRQGLKIKHIQDNSGVRMVAQKEMLPQSTERIVEVQGTPEGIQRAIWEICKCLVDDWQRGTGTVLYNPVVRTQTGSSSLSGNGFSSTTTREYSSPRVMRTGNGSDFSNGAGRPFPRRDDSDSGLRGPPTHDENGEEIQTQNISIPADMVGCIIGRAGSKISEIRKTSGARISIAKAPHDETGERMFTIMGTAKANESALFLLYENLEAEKMRRSQLEE